MQSYDTDQCTFATNKAGLACGCIAIKPGHSMKPGLIIFCLLLSIHPMSSWSLDSVIVGNQEWLQPADFEGYTYNQVSEACPQRTCSGELAGGVDLTGYTWASSDEVEQLFAAYTRAGKTILSDFDPMSRNTDIGDIIWAVLGDPPVEFPNRREVLYAFINGDTTGENKVILNQSIGLDGPLLGGPWFWKPLENVNIQIKLEEPINGQTHSGIGNLRGWAVAEDGIDRVEIYIDGKYVYNAPYGGSRGDVKQAYPEIPDSGHSGFSLALGYSNLGFGQHTIMARAFNKSGEWADASSTFNVVAFDKKFIEKGDVVDASEAQATTTGDEIIIENILIGDRRYNLRLKWRTEEQGFEIVEIR